MPGQRRRPLLVPVQAQSRLYLPPCLRDIEGLLAVPYANHAASRATVTSGVHSSIARKKESATTTVDFHWVWSVQAKRYNSRMADVGAEGEFHAGEELDGTLEGGFQGGSAGTDDVADAQAVRSDGW